MATSSPQAELSLDLPVTIIKGVGEKIAPTLAKLDLHTVGDLLGHYPRRYEDRSQFIPIGQVCDGQTVLIAGKVTGVENRPTKTRMVITKVTVDDDSPSVASLTWFNQWRMKQTFDKMVGKRIVAYGVAKRGYSAVEIVQPEWELLDEGGEENSLSVGRIVPIYALTEGLGEKVLRKIIAQAVEKFAGQVPESLPEVLRQKRDLMPACEAIRNIHFPANQEALDAARKRLVYEEFIALQLLLAGRKQAGRTAEGIVFPDTNGPLVKFADVLPFTMTAAQKRVTQEIARDMQSPHAMNRLVQGDVGSGKTAVALAAMAIAHENGYQAALMAPTEILAEQHYKNVQNTLQKLNIRVDLLTGSLPAKEKSAVRARVESGETGVVVGTHALIQDSVSFAKLGLVVIDEQHRFGVMQRAALSGKGNTPDVLVMTATPIPRTLTLTVYGDLDVSIIDELPPGRKPITTHWKRGTNKKTVYAGVKSLLKQGRQAYVVCSLVEESEKLQARAAVALAEQLAGEFAEFSVGLLHGQMPPTEKDDVMQRFRANEVQLLVATTVIEVGVDVPNAVVMIIEDADRFGLAQLHQLRGRVGRGQHESFCVLLADPATPDGQTRMRVLCETSDGFRIAEEDLCLRGPGEFYGVRQSGIAGLKIADVLRDRDLLTEARDDAFAVIADDPKLAKAENRGLRRMVLSARNAAQTEAAGVA